MKQSRAMSFVESCVNVAVGYGVAIAAQMLVFPLFGIHASLRDNLLIGLIFTVVSIARSFALRRLFEAVRYRRDGNDSVTDERSSARLELLNYLKAHQKTSRGHRGSSA